MSQLPWSLGRFSGRRPCARSAIARSPRREVVSGPAQLGVPTPRHLGVENSDVDKAVAPAWQLGSGLFGMPAREIRVNPLL